MNKFIASLLFLIALTFLFSSCGLIFGGTKYRGTIVVKDHPDAKILVDGEEVGKGTVTELFPRSQPLVVELSKEGCPTQKNSYPISMRNGSLVLTAISWGVTGLLVDIASGAAYKPRHRKVPEVEKLTTKNFLFTIEYTDCDGSEGAESKERDKIDIDPEKDDYDYAK